MIDSPDTSYELDAVRPSELNYDSSIRPTLPHGVDRSDYGRRPENSDGTQNNTWHWSVYNTSTYVWMLAGCG